jgi:hypothetical protein
MHRVMVCEEMRLLIDDWLYILYMIIDNRSYVAYHMTLFRDIRDLDLSR